MNTDQSGVFKPSTETLVDTLKNAVSPNKNAGCGHVDTLKAGMPEREKAENNASASKSDGCGETLQSSQSHAKNEVADRGGRRQKGVLEWEA